LRCLDLRTAFIRIAPWCFEHGAGTAALPRKFVQWKRQWCSTGITPDNTMATQYSSRNLWFWVVRLGSRARNCEREVNTYE
jgi:hypothetical protein